MLAYKYIGFISTKEGGEEGREEEGKRGKDEEQVM